jgi:hypothetical protein
MAPQSGFKGVFRFFRSSTSSTSIHVAIEVRSVSVAFLPRSFLIFRRIRIPVIHAETTEMIIKTPSMSRKFHAPCQWMLDRIPRIELSITSKFKEVRRIILTMIGA